MTGLMCCAIKLYLTEQFLTKSFYRKSIIQLFNHEYFISLIIPVMGVEERDLPTWRDKT